jgi:hypothetical protein
MKKIDCETPGKMVLEDVAFFSENINYEVVYVLCPPGCNKGGISLGRSIYSPDS